MRNDIALKSSLLLEETENSTSYVTYIHFNAPFYTKLFLRIS